MNSDWLCGFFFQLVQAALDNVTQGISTITIAHRLSTIVHADMIYVVDKGRVVQKGTHHNLIRLVNGPYFKLWSSQNE